MQSRLRANAKPATIGSFEHENHRTNNKFFTRKLDSAIPLPPSLNMVPFTRLGMKGTEKKNSDATLKVLILLLIDLAYANYFAKKILQPRNDV